jgi:hypothetical protein
MSTAIRKSYLAAVTAVMALVLAIAMAPQPADAGTKVVRKTFSSNQPIIIPAGAPGTTSGTAAPYPSERNAFGFKRGRILDVNLTLKNFSHTYSDDVNVLLSHRGKTRLVMSDVGGDTDANNITIRLDDEAANKLPDESALSAGSFRPTNVGGGDAFPAPAPATSGKVLLKGFDGENPNGAWRLWVVDDAGNDVGQFAGGWSITIRARVQT